MNTNKSKNAPIGKQTKNGSAIYRAVKAANLDNPEHCQPGLKAIKHEYREFIKPASTKRLTESIDLDSALEEVMPQDHRWDYGIGLSLANNGPEILFWVEFHEASTSQVDRVLKKLDWLQLQLTKHKGLNQLTKATIANGHVPFHWMPTGNGVHIHSHMPQARRLAARGMKVPTTILRLP